MTEVEEIEEVDIKDAFSSKLIVWNDDHNSFQDVIEALITVCKHNLQQAEQCTLIIHNNGKCAVKDGDYDKLKPMKEAITERGIKATIS